MVDMEGLRKDLREAVDSLRVDIRDVKHEVTSRQDKTNGRLDRHDERHHEQMQLMAEHGRLIAGLTARVENLNHEVFKRPRQNTDDALAALTRALRDQGTEPLTRRDADVAKNTAKLLWTVLAALCGLAAWAYAALQ